MIVLLLLVHFILLLLLWNYDFSGIGQVPFITLVVPADTPHLCIEWVEPVFVSNNVMGLMYIVSVEGADISILNVTTSETHYCLDELTPCQKYNITVTPFSTSPYYVGASNRTTGTIDGGKLRK